MDRGVMVGVLQTWAADAAALVDQLRAQDPNWGSAQFPFGGGLAVLSGSGLYVNRSFAAGLEGPIHDDDWLRFEQHCRGLDVPPTVEVSPATSLAAVDQLHERGYQPADATSALLLDLGGLDESSSSDPSIVIATVGPDRLALWQTTAADGWGHTAPSALRANNAFASAAATVADVQMLVALDRDLELPIGCASLIVRNSIATLGGMSTLPDHRRRGVQSALINHRLRTAKSLGCDLATTTAMPGQASERNLIRHGFERCFTLRNYTLEG